MDLVAVIGLISAILSIPPSIYWFIQKHRDSQAAKRPLEDAGATRKAYVHLVSSLSDRSDRNLLTFDKSNCEKPGTFEHLAWGYWKQFKQLEPNEMGGTRENDFIYNPVGVLAASQVRGSYYRANRPGLLFGPIVLSFAVPMMLASGMVKLFGEESMWGFALSIPIFAILVPLGFITGLRAVRSNRKNLRDAIQALEPIRQYVAALQDMGIIVQLEFTQLKSKATGAGTAPSNIVPNEAAA